LIFLLNIITNSSDKHDPLTVEEEKRFFERAVKGDTAVFENIYRSYVKEN